MCRHGVAQGVRALGIIASLYCGRRLRWVVLDSLSDKAQASGRGVAVRASRWVGPALLDVRVLVTSFGSQRGGRVRAVDGVSFRVPPRSTVGLVGESGCGKSVTSLSLMRLVPSPPGAIESGEVWFDGRDLMKLSEREMRRVRGASIAMVFQEPMTSLNPLHTIEKQIGEILALHAGLTGAKARARIVELLEEVGIRDAAKRLDAYPHQLSGGQRQRVMIAMALANEPDLLIADEPTTALDVTVQAQILALLKEIQKRRGMAMLFITHDLRVAAQLCDTVIVMHRGEIVEHGPTASLYAQPQHDYTRRLLASVPGAHA